MEIRVSGRNMRVTEGMKDHLKERLSKLEKYAPRLVEAHVILKKQKYLYEAEITILAKNFKAFGDGQSKVNIFTAVDLASDRVEKQLKRHREKVKDHHKKVSIASEESPEGSGTSGPAIIPDRSFASKPMSISEASMQLQLLQKPFIVFQDAGSKKVNVLFKRHDGNHGLITPEF